MNSLFWLHLFILGGAGGSVVASSLSEHPEWSVLLVEAGPDEPAGTQVPSNLQVFLGNIRFVLFLIGKRSTRAVNFDHIHDYRYGFGLEVSNHKRIARVLENQW